MNGFADVRGRFDSYFCVTPTIRLGGEREAIDGAPAETAAKLRRGPLELGGISTRVLSTAGRGRRVLLLHGWLDNAETWLEVLARLGAAGRSAVAYDQPGFGAAPPLREGSVIDQLTDFAALAVERFADEAGEDAVVAGNSLGGWVALRLAERRGLPLAGVVPIAPAGIRMAPLFFSADRIPAASRILSLPAPVPPAALRSVVGRLYRTLGFADPATVDQAVIDRFTRFNADRPVVRERLDYAKRLRSELARPFAPERIEVPVIVLWGDRDRLCLPAGAAELAKLLPHARIELLPGIGHTPQVEAPERVVAAIEALAAA
jgi:pimeloyl-ACP methyl ester carboxylesterase